MRGTGLSQHSVSDLSHSALVLDVEAVVAAAGAKRLSIFAPGLSGPRAIEYAARHPRSVSALVLHVTFARTLDVYSRDMLAGLAALSRANWDQATRTFADLGWRRRVGDEGLQAAGVIRESASGETMARIIESNIELDVSNLLPQIKCPTLVMSPQGNSMIAPSIGQAIASAVPNCRLVSAPADDLALVLGNETPTRIANEFLVQVEAPQPKRSRRRPPASAFRTVLFTDLVGHTEMMSRLGDEAGRAVLREHETITRNVLKTHGGTEVKTMGDGFMASFGSVTRAVECAIALQRAFAEREGEPLSVRVGLNAGEPIEEDGDLFGATVILASRIAAKAEGGEILVADTVRGLCSGKGFLFADRGDFVAKGFEDPVRVYEVRWRE